MPVYTYKCNNCDVKKEEWFPLFEDAVTHKDCSICEGVVNRVVDFGNPLLNHEKKFTGKMRPKKALVDGKVVDLTK